MIKKLLSILGAIISFIVILIAIGIGGQVGKEVGRAAVSPSKPTEKEILAKVAEGFEFAAKQINDSAPTMVDEETRMDGVSVGPGALLTYHYTFPNYSSSDLDFGLIKSNVFTSIKNGVCSNKEMKPSLQYGGRYVYSYSGRDGVLIGEFTIDRNSCGFSAMSPSSSARDQGGTSSPRPIAEVAQKSSGKANAPTSAAFLDQNKAKEGVTTTASGLQYEVITVGIGPRPSAEDTVEVHYRGTLVDGTEFDSSYNRGEATTFGVGQVIPGWTEALQLMPVGSKWKLAIPPDLAYGSTGAGNVIGPNAALIFEVELISIRNQ